MKKYMLLCAGLCAAMALTSCKSSESAYKKAYEKAKAQEARAKVIEAEAEIPKAIADAFRTGNLGLMDYYKFQNIQADTRMRDNIADPQKSKPTPRNPDSPVK